MTDLEEFVKMPSLDKRFKYDLLYFKLYYLITAVSSRLETRTHGGHLLLTTIKLGEKK